MNANIGSLDKSLRLVSGVLLLGAAFVLGNIWPGLLGVVLVGTALASRCPLYLPFGFSTRGSS
ncbi:MAG: DUF2892 domain-containing protein [Candidatus Sericytochromatia bacterium]